MPFPSLLVASVRKANVTSARVRLLNAMGDHELDAMLLRDHRPILRVACDASALTTWAWSRASVATIRFVRGRRMSTPADLMDEWAAALQFPYYFGNNWNAFDEVMADLEWLPEGRILVLVLDAERLLPDPDDHRALVELVGRAAAELAGSHRTLSVVMVEREPPVTIAPA